MAKARSHTSRDLDLVLYPSAAEGTFTLGISRLKPGQAYSYGEKTIEADSKGEISIGVLVKGRTPVHIQPVE